MRYLFTIICGLYVLISPQICFAMWKCVANTSTISISPQSIGVTNSTPVDTKIGSTTLSASSVIYTCTADEQEIKNYQFSVVSTGSYIKTINGKRIYQSNVQGIGYALGAELSGPSGCSIDGWIGDGNTYNSNLNSRVYCLLPYPSTFTGTAIFSGRIKVEFYKIGESIASGIVSLGTVGNMVLAPNFLDSYPSKPNITVNSFNNIKPSCQIASPNNVTVNMGSVEKKDFNGIGTAASTVGRGSYALQCPKGTDVYVQVDGNVLDASKGLLNITPGSSSATGVAIQLLNGDIPFTLSTPVYAGRTDGDFSFLSFTARYYQSEPNITPGVANATATVTLTYQ